MATSPKSSLFLVSTGYDIMLPGVSGYLENVLRISQCFLEGSCAFILRQVSFFCSGYES